MIRLTGFFYSGDADGELIARLCGQTAPAVPLVVAAPRIWAHFRSDEHVEDRGFSAYYIFECKCHDRQLFSLPASNISLPCCNFRLLFLVLFPVDMKNN